MINHYFVHHPLVVRECVYSTVYFETFILKCIFSLLICTKVFSKFVLCPLWHSGHALLCHLVVVINCDDGYFSQEGVIKIIKKSKIQISLFFLACLWVFTVKKFINSLLLFVQKKKLADCDTLWLYKQHFNSRVFILRSQSVHHDTTISLNTLSATPIQVRTKS